MAVSDEHLAPYNTVYGGGGVYGGAAIKAFFDTKVRNVATVITSDLLHLREQMRKAARQATTNAELAFNDWQLAFSSNSVISRPSSAKDKRCSVIGKIGSKGSNFGNGKVDLLPKIVGG